MNPRLKLTKLRVKATPPSPSGWKMLLGLAITYGALYAMTLRAFSTLPPPLPVDAPTHLFAEGRAMATTVHLAATIGHRQVSTPGEAAAAAYLLTEARAIVAAAAVSRPDLEVTADVETVSGALGRQIVFGMEIANAYNGLTNVVLRVAPRPEGNASAGPPPKAVLINAHYDSTLGTPGASDAASCVGVALEMARTVVAAPALRPAAPLVFLFNGGEETLMQASHGFMASSPHAANLGAFINLESTGPWGPDVVFQHTGDWTLRAYARVAPSPRGTTVGQDFFDLGVIPGDTDYRMFSYRHYGEVPGIDVAFLFDGTAYHTARDEPSRIRPGTLQGMGENLLPAALEFARVLAAGDFGGEHHEEDAPGGGHVFFDVLSTFMIVYTHRTAVVLHFLPLVGLLVASLAAAAAREAGRAPGKVPPPGALLREAGRGVAGLAGAVVAPAALGAIRVLITRRPLSWYSANGAAYTAFLPAAAAGLLAPWALGGSWDKPALVRARAGSLGVALLFAGAAAGLIAAGMHSSYLFAVWAVGAAAAAAALPPPAFPPSSQQGFTWRDVAAVALAFTGPIVTTLPTAMSTAGHVMEKIGLSGSAEGALGAAVPDAAVGALTGVGFMLAMGASAPYVAAALGRRRARAAVAALAVVAVAVAAGQAAAAAGRAHPYSHRSPKRLIFQHVHRHGTDGGVSDSFFTFSSMDAIPVTVPGALPPGVVASPDHPYSNFDWVALYPLNSLVTGTAKAAPPPARGERAPTLKLLAANGGGGGPERASGDGNLWVRVVAWWKGAGEEKEAEQEGGGGGAPAAGLRRWRLELDTVRPAWAVLNITGDVRAWSLGPEVATTPIPGAANASCHMVRYASGHAVRRWRFWVDTPAAGGGAPPLRVALFVKHLEPSSAAAAVAAAMPDWVSPAAVTTWASTWEFA